MNKETKKNEFAGLTAEQKRFRLMERLHDIAETHRRDNPDLYVKNEVEDVEDVEEVGMFGPCSLYACD